MAKGLKPIDQNRPADLSQAVHFGHNYPTISPPTPGRVKPDIVFRRKVFNDKLTMPDGRDIEYWAYESPDDDKPFPSTPMRARVGQVVHTELRSSINAHTIHHHGIEPSTFNDGVPDKSFAVNSDYTYQWRASKAGTYFYHCHRNTPLHVQMGMFGYLIVDPPEGPGRLYSGGPDYDVELAWAPYDIDPSWREYNHASGEKRAEGIALHRYEPTYFTVNGVAGRAARRSPKTVGEARRGQTVLLRHLCGTFSPTVTRFPASLNATIVGSDAVRLARGPHRTNAFRSTMAERYEVLLRPTRRGTFPVTYEFHSYLGDRVLGVAHAYLVVR